MVHRLEPFHGYPVDRVPGQHPLADRVLRHLRDGHADRPHEQRVGDLDLQRRHREVAGPQVERQPRLAVVLGGFGDLRGHRLGRGGFAGDRVQPRARERDRLGPAIVHRQAQERPDAFGEPDPNLAHAVGLTEDRLAAGQRLPGLLVRRAFHRHRFDERHGRRVQRDRVQRLGDAGLQRDHGHLAFEPDLETFRPARRHRVGNRPLDQVRHFPPGAVDNAQVLQPGPRRIERLGRQAELEEAGLGHVQRLRLFPIGRQRAPHRGGAQQIQEKGFHLVLVSGGTNRW